MRWRPVSIEAGKKGPVVRIHWPRLGLFLLLAAAGCWLAVAFGAWWLVKYHRHIPGVSYADLLWPGRWPVYRVSEGNYFIARAGELLRHGEANAALHHLRAGLARVPAHARGRTTLAELYLACRRPDLAQSVLLDGLRHLADDPAYLRATLSLLLEFQEDAKLLTVAERLLAAPGNSDSHALAATFAATAAYYRGNYDRAEDFIVRHQLQESNDGALLLARLEWARGYPELALLRLDELISRQPGHDGARALLAGYYRDLGRTPELASALVERLASDPLAPAPRIEYLQLHHQRGDPARLERDAAAYLGQFQHDPAALLLLADFAARTGRPALARRVQEILIARRETHGAAALLVAEAHLVAGEYPATLALVAGYERDHPEWSEQFAAIGHGLRAVAHCGLGRTDDARLDLNHLLAGKNIRADNLVAVSNRLAALGARDLARAALSRAVEADPLNQAALTSLLRLELDTGNIAALPAHLDRYLSMRQPSREILARAYAAVGSDRQLFLPAQSGLLASLRTVLDPGRP
jgi:predicted Zn-dependent protease